MDVEKMVEDVARDTWETMRASGPDVAGYPAWDDLSDAARNDFKKNVSSVAIRAVLDGIREPDAEMLEAGYCVTRSSFDDAPATVETFQAMIDHLRERLDA